MLTSEWKPSHYQTPRLAASLPKKGGFRTRNTQLLGPSPPGGLLHTCTLSPFLRHVCVHSSIVANEIYSNKIQYYEMKIVKFIQPFSFRSDKVTEFAASNWAKMGICLTSLYCMYSIFLNTRVPSKPGGFCHGVCVRGGYVVLWSRTRTTCCLCYDLVV